MSAAPENSATLFVYASQSQATGEVTAHQAEGGFTAREHAAIALRVPDSGTDWLDKLIIAALHNQYAGQAMQAMITKSSGQDSTGGKAGVPLIAKYAHEYADAMLSGAQIAEGE